MCVEIKKSENAAFLIELTYRQHPPPQKMTYWRHLLYLSQPMQRYTYIIYT